MCRLIVKSVFVAENILIHCSRTHMVDGFYLLSKRKSLFSPFIVFSPLHRTTRKLRLHFLRDAVLPATLVLSIKRIKMKKKLFEKFMTNKKTKQLKAREEEG